MRTMELAGRDRVPMLGLGTWKSEPGQVLAAVQEAVRIGYRHIDCAPIYFNEPDVGQALSMCFRSGVVSRDEMWITSKLWNDCHAPEDVQPALNKTLSDLNLDYLDLYLIHWPVALRKGVIVPESAAGENIKSRDVCDLNIRNACRDLRRSIRGIERNLDLERTARAEFHVQPAKPFPKCRRAQIRE